MTHCTPAQSLALKEIGFDKPVKDYIYTGDTGNNINRYFHTLKADNHNADPLCISQPTPYEVLQWAREKKGLHGWVEPFVTHLFNRWTYCITIKNVGLTALGSAIYPTHPEAESALIDKLITILEKQKT